MANFYWVGGSASWTGSNAGNWASSSGGTGGAGIPSINDNVFFDQNSGTNAVINVGGAGVNCYNLNTSTFTGTFRGVSRNIGVWGESVIIGNATTFYGGSTGTSVGIYLAGAGKSVTITNVNGYFRALYLDGAGSTVTITSNLYNTYVEHRQGTLTVANGISVVGSYSVYNNSNVKVLNMGTAYWHMGAFNATDSFNTFTLNKQSATIIATASTGSDTSYFFGGKEYNELRLTGEIPYHTLYILGGGTFSKLYKKFTGAPSNIAFDSGTPTTIETLEVAGLVQNVDWTTTLYATTSNISPNVIFNGVPTEPRYGTVVFPNAGSIRIGDEVITYTSYTYDSAFNITTLGGVTRGANGTKAAFHQAGDVVSIPYYIGLVSNDPGNATATVNIKTANGVFYAGINSMNLGNNQGNIAYTSSGSANDYLTIKDINLNVTAKPDGATTSFFLFG